LGAVNSTRLNKSFTLRIVTKTCCYAGARAFPLLPSTFDTAAYSRFKYGDGEVAAHYGASLFQLLVRTGDIVASEPLFVSGSAYYTAPTAAAGIADALAASLQHNDFDATLFRIFCNPYTADYGAMDAAARTAALSDTSLHLDPTVAKHMPGNTLILVDDIRITGRHESALRPLLKRVGAGIVFFCYVAVFDQAQGERDPQVEDRLNHTYVKDLRQLLALSQQQKFLPNARMCKFVLRSDAGDMRIFGWSLDPDVLSSLLNYIVADGYHLSPQYAHQYTLLQSIADARSAI
jgi:hypothetical protein